MSEIRTKATPAPSPGAVPLNTSTFVESWPKLDEALADVSRDEPVHMFCTGGVRCVKAGAYVKQKLGFTDVRRLEHGVVPTAVGGGSGESRFEGENFCVRQARVETGCRGRLRPFGRVETSAHPVRSIWRTPAVDREATPIHATATNVARSALRTTGETLYASYARRLRAGQNGVSERSERKVGPRELE